jgi:hypothetical protein
MAKKKKVQSLEDRFIEFLRANNMTWDNKLFGLGDKLYLPTFVFGKLIVEVEDFVSKHRMEKMRLFKSHNPEYTFYLLTKDEESCIDAAKDFHEVFTWDSVQKLLGQIRRHKKGIK